jgi:hypothetical protein
MNHQKRQMNTIDMKGVVIISWNCKFVLIRFCSFCHKEVLTPVLTCLSIFEIFNARKTCNLIKRIHEDQYPFLLGGRKLVQKVRRGSSMIRQMKDR